MRLQKELKNALFEGYQLFQGIRLLRDPSRLDIALAIANARLQQATPDDAQQQAAKIPWTKAALKAVEDRYRFIIPPVESLVSCPKGSLGHGFASFLRQEGIDPKDLTPAVVDDDLSYLAAHIAETHDLWHFMTGFATDLDGEAGVAAFAAAQIGAPIQFEVLTGALVIGQRQSPWELSSRLESIVRGWQMGKEAKLLLGIRWDQLWDEPVGQLRRQLKIQVKDG